MGVGPIRGFAYDRDRDRLFMAGLATGSPTPLRWLDLAGCDLALPLRRRRVPARLGDLPDAPRRPRAPRDRPRPLRDPGRAPRAGRPDPRLPHRPPLRHGLGRHRRRPHHRLRRAPPRGGPRRERVRRRRSAARLASWTSGTARRTSGCSRASRRGPRTAATWWRRSSVDEGSLWIYDDETHALVSFRTNELTGGPVLGHNPFGLAVDPAAIGTTARLWVGSYADSFVTPIDVPLDAPERRRVRRRRPAQDHRSDAVTNRIVAIAALAAALTACTSATAPAHRRRVRRAVGGRRVPRRDHEVRARPGGGEHGGPVPPVHRRRELGLERPHPRRRDGRHAPPGAAAAPHPRLPGPGAAAPARRRGPRRRQPGPARRGDGRRPAVARRLEARGDPDLGRRRRGGRVGGARRGHPRPRGPPLRPGLDRDGAARRCPGGRSGSRSSRSGARARGTGRRSTSPARRSSRARPSGSSRWTWRSSRAIAPASSPRATIRSRARAASSASRRSRSRGAGVRVRRGLNALAPTRLVAAARLVGGGPAARRRLASDRRDASTRTAFVGRPAVDRVYAVLDESGCGLRAKIACGLVALDPVTRAPPPGPDAGRDDARALPRAAPGGRRRGAGRHRPPPGDRRSPAEPQYGGDVPADRRERRHAGIRPPPPPSRRPTARSPSWTSGGGTSRASSSSSRVTQAKVASSSAQRHHRHPVARPPGSGEPRERRRPRRRRHRDRGVTPRAISWVVTREGVLPGLSGLRAEAGNDAGTTPWLALQQTAAAGRSRARCTCRTRPWASAPATRSSSTRSRSAPAPGSRRPSPSSCAPDARRPGGYVLLGHRVLTPDTPTVPAATLTAWNRCVDELALLPAAPPFVGLAPAPPFFAATFRAGGYVLTRGTGTSTVHVGRPEIRARFDVAWEDEARSRRGARPCSGVRPRDAALRVRRGSRGAPAT